MNSEIRQRVGAEDLFKQLQEVIPGGVNSPVRAFKGLLDAPLIAESGSGALLTDYDGNSYIDFCSSWGALIHGHAHPGILQPVIERLHKGSTFGATTEVEERLAREVVQMVDSVEQVRFVSSGTEATMSALRLARGFTGRSKIVKFEGCYHGHSDMLLVKAGSGVLGLHESSSSGVPSSAVEETVCLRYNDCEQLEKALTEEVAAVILEPIAGNMGVVPGEKEFIDLLFAKAKEVGTLVVYDEVMTGFRLSSQGAQGLHGVKPDLSCFGKIIGGGFNVAAFGGRKDVMQHLAPQGSVYQAGTLSGNPVAMEAGYHALKMVQVPGFYEELERKSAQIERALRDAAGDRKCAIQRVGSMISIFFGLERVRNFDDVQNIDREEFARFFRALYKEGVFLPPSANEAWFISAALTEGQIAKTADLLYKALR